MSSTFGSDGPKVLYCRQLWARMANKCNTLVNFWVGWPKSAILSSTFGSDGPKVQYCRQLSALIAQTCSTVVQVIGSDSKESGHQESQKRRRTTEIRKNKFIFKFIWFGRPVRAGRPDSRNTLGRCVIWWIATRRRGSAGERSTSSTSGVGQTMLQLAGANRGAIYRL